MSIGNKVYSTALIGLQSSLIEVEADVSKGLHSFQIVGLPDKSIDEAKERVSSALKNNGFKHPRAFNKRTVINLAPADLKKEGGMYDVPLALSFLLASKQAKFDPSNHLFVGELSLDGRIRPIKGALSFAVLAKEMGFASIVVPAENREEASLIKGIKVVGPANIAELIRYLEQNKLPPNIQKVGAQQKRTASGLLDMSHISGHYNVKLALEIAAAGNHNILMQGPPGSGKTILAKALVGILPDMSYEESIEVTKIYSVAGKTDTENPLIKSRPFRSPHHSSSEVALIGGGSSIKPGEITLAHRGVLFLDEFPEFHRDVLESLRQPIESGEISIARAKGEAKFPANFILVAASNPCPCGFYNDPEKDCKCYPSQIQKYRKKLSGPIADRIDIHIEVPHQNYNVLTSDKTAEPSSSVKKRVLNARAIQKERFRAYPNMLTNNDMGIPEIKKYCHAPKEAENILERAVNKDRLSARAYHKVLKLSRTMADLSEREQISTQDVLGAISYNSQK